MRFSGQKKIGEGERRNAPRALPLRETVLVRGDRLVTVYGCKKILRYAPEEVLFSLGGRRVLIYGSGLVCISFTAGSVTVEGTLAGVCFQ